MLLLKERTVLYTLHVHVPLKGPKQNGYDGVSLPGQPIYSRGIVWMVSCPCMTCSSAVRSAALIRLLHVILNHFLGVPRACMLTDQVLALYVVCALLCNDDDMYYCHITTRISCIWA